MNFAIYGKGGIGKSTIASNLSCAFAKRNKSVLQIGCDPKHDSTLLLRDSTQEVKTVIEFLCSNIAPTYEDIVYSSKYQIDCLELGGPQPGLGCAGRGIISGLEYLSTLPSFDTNAYDCVIYDILGDVVCGGFFEPLKRKKVEELYIVTSGEFNSLFAANNLCKGYLNCKLEKKGIRLGGLIGNCRDSVNEEAIIRKFAEALNLNLVALIPRDNRIEKSTIDCLPITVAYPDSDLEKIFNNICDYIEKPEKEIHIPTPLELCEMRALVKEFYE